MDFRVVAADGNRFVTVYKYCLKNQVMIFKIENVLDRISFPT